MNTIQFVDESPAALNGPFVVESPAMKRSSGEAGLDSDSDSDSEMRNASEPQTRDGPRPGYVTSTTLLHKQLLLAKNFDIRSEAHISKFFAIRLE